MIAGNESPDGEPTDGDDYLVAFGRVLYKMGAEPENSLAREIMEPFLMKEGLLCRF